MFFSLFFSHILSSSLLYFNSNSGSVLSFVMYHLLPFFYYLLRDVISLVSVFVLLKYSVGIDFIIPFRAHFPSLDRRSVLEFVAYQ